MPGIKHFYFLDSIGQGDWFSYGTTLEDVRYGVEGYAAFEGELADATALPEEVVFHYPKCYGGDVWEGYGIYNYKRSLSARGVKTTSIVEGLCASIATLTALGSDTVLMADAAFWMVHKPMVDAGPNANADDHVAATAVLNKIQDQLAGRYVARSGGKLDSGTAHALINQTSWLTADECLAYGFITGKLEDAPLVAPVGAEKVLNFLPKTALKNVIMPTPTAPEKPSMFAEFMTEARAFFAGAKNETEAEVPVAPTSASSEVTDGDPMYYDGELAQGTAVFSDEAQTIAYPDGTYALADGREALVTGGAIETLSDPPATDETATNTAETEALTTELTELKAENALLQRKLTAAQNKLNKVPGSTGTPTPPGTAQNIGARIGAPANSAPASPIRFKA